MTTWTQSGAGAEAVQYTADCIGTFAVGAACRQLYAEGLPVLAADVGIGGGRDDRTAPMADEWADVAEILSDADAANPQPALDEAARVIEGTAEQGEAFFEHVREAL